MVRQQQQTKGFFDHFREMITNLGLATSDLYRPILRAPRFYLPINTREGLGGDDWDKKIHARSLEDATADFLMPFPEVVIEDDTSAVFIRLLKGEDADWFGSYFGFIDVRRVSEYPFLIFTTTQLSPRVREMDGSIQYMMAPIAHSVIPQHGKARVRVYDTQKADDDVMRVAKMVTDAFSVATRQLAVINSPLNWVVREESLVRLRISRDKKKFAERKRVRYVVVPKIKAIAMYHTANPSAEGVTRAPHIRRAHWRVLRAERHKEKIGTRVKVRSHWVGERDFSAEGIQYRVILDPYEEIK